MNNSNKCFHNYPYVDENPAYYELVEDKNPALNGRLNYKCKYCGVLYVCNLFTKEGKTFQEGINLQKNNS